MKKILEHNQLLFLIRSVTMCNFINKSFRKMNLNGKYYKERILFILHMDYESFCEHQMELQYVNRCAKTFKLLGNIHKLRWQAKRRTVKQLLKL